MNGQNNMNTQGNGNYNNGMNNNQVNQYTPNNRVIRSANVNGGYESLDDDLTKDEIQRQKREANTSFSNEMNMMSNMVASTPIPEEPKEENFLDRVKNKGLELFDKVRGEAKSSLSDASLLKMDQMNQKMNEPNTSSNQNMSNPGVSSNLEQRPMNQPVQQNNNQVPQQPVPKIQNYNQGQLSNQMNMNPNIQNQMFPNPNMNQQMGGQVRNTNQMNSRLGATKVSKKDVFAGLPAGNQNKGGFLKNIFQKKNDSNVNNPDVVEPWMLNQPLSAKSLGISDNEVKKDMVVSNTNQKYFNNSDDTRFNQDNSLHPENFAKPLFQKKEVVKKNNGTLIRNYLGDDYDSIAMGIFSFSAFFFGGLHFISHRLLVLGLALFAAQMYILCYIPWKTGIIVYLVFSAVLGFLANPIIMNTVKMRVSIMRSTHPKFVEIQFNELAKVKGRKLSSLSFLLLIGFIGLTAFLYFVNGVEFKGLVGKGYGSIQSMLSAQTKVEDITITYNDELSPNSYFTYTIPDGFVKKDNVYQLVFEEGDNHYCEFSFRAINNYTESPKLMSDIKKKYKVSSSVSSATYNGVVYQSLEYSNNKGKYYKLSVKMDDTVYLLEYFSGENTPINVCDNHYKDITSSLKKIEVSKPEES